MHLMPRFVSLAIFMPLSPDNVGKASGIMFLGCPSAAVVLLFIC